MSAGFADGVAIRVAARLVPYGALVVPLEAYGGSVVSVARPLRSGEEDARLRFRLSGAFIFRPFCRACVRPVASVCVCVGVLMSVCMSVSVSLTVCLSACVKSKCVQPSKDLTTVGSEGYSRREDNLYIQRITVL